MGAVHTPFVVTAPVRIADVGGWTDTWFAGSGRVCSLAVRPGARVVFTPGQDTSDERVVEMRVDLTGEAYRIDRVALTGGVLPGRHPVLEAAVAALAPPVSVRIDVAADVPAGSGLGTSASVTVALLAGLARLREMDLSPAELAAMAHGVELRVGLESGVQDQWAAAHGGIGDIAVDYPGARHTPIEPSPSVLAELDARLITVYLGRPHSSSQVHEEVIAGFATHDPSLELDRLRSAAGHAADALLLGDLDAFGAALVDAHETVRSFHPSLICATADAVAEVAGRHGASGWKANGAAGDGGTVTIVGSADAARRAAMIETLSTLDGVAVLDLHLSADGVTIRPV
jgi:D-glycero-alpha-D-manno-heptose-7-phosphate kinase